MHEVLVNHLGGLSLPRKSVVRLTDRPDMTLDVYRGRKTTMQQPSQLGSISFSAGINFLLNWGQFLKERSSSVFKFFLLRVQPRKSLLTPFALKKAFFECSRVKGGKLEITKVVSHGKKM